MSFPESEICPSRRDPLVPAAGAFCGRRGERAAERREPGPAAERSFWLPEREKSRGGAGLID